MNISGARGIGAACLFRLSLSWPVCYRLLRLIHRRCGCNVHQLTQLCALSTAEPLAPTRACVALLFPKAQYFVRAPHSASSRAAVCRLAHAPLRRPRHLREQEQRQRLSV
jgi:hypothetical protein